MVDLAANLLPYGAAAAAGLGASMTRQQEKTREAFGQQSYGVLQAVHARDELALQVSRTRGQEETMGFTPAVLTAQICSAC